MLLCDNTMQDVTTNNISNEVADTRDLILKTIYSYRKKWQMDVLGFFKVNRLFQ